MGTCTCSRDVAPTPTNYGGTLKWTWAEGHKFSTWRGSPRFCNPMNCSNKGCHTKGCAQARALFCSQHGFHCPSLGKKVCFGDSCPGGLKTCLNAPYEIAQYGDLPLCADIPKGGGNGSTSPPSGVDTRNCAQGNIMSCFSEIGVATGNFFKDSAKTGGEQLPLMLLLGAGLVLVLLLKR